MENRAGEKVRILFCRIGWMEDYKGLDNDQINGGGLYIEENEFGHEIHNFSIETNETGEYCYGYVMSQGKDGFIGIERLGANREDSSIDDILVVWVATHPNGGERIIGWYKHATVYRIFQPPVNGSNRYDDDCWWNVESNAENCTLLPVGQRKFIIPRATKDSPGIGRSNVWYAEGIKNEKLVDTVIDYIKNYKVSEV